MVSLMLTSSIPLETCTVPKSKDYASTKIYLYAGAYPRDGQRVSCKNSSLSTRDRI